MEPVRAEADVAPSDSDAPDMLIDAKRIGSVNSIVNVTGSTAIKTVGSVAIVKLNDTSCGRVESAVYVRTALAFELGTMAKEFGPAAVSTNAP
jgi:hypothetical protein